MLLLSSLAEPELRRGSHSTFAFNEDKLINFQNLFLTFLTLIKLLQMSFERLRNTASTFYNLVNIRTFELPAKCDALPLHDNMTT